MITGDALLTALHVARVTKIVQNEIFLLEKNGEEYKWRHGDKDDHWAEFSDFEKLGELGMTGAGLSWLVDNQPESVLRKVLPRVRVFARTSPTQKENIIIKLKVSYAQPFVSL